MLEVDAGAGGDVDELRDGGAGGCSLREDEGREDARAEQCGEDCAPAGCFGEGE